jgi:Zinc finger C-x8-C-x5-C-x3-H type (and similar)
MSSTNRTQGNWRKGGRRQPGSGSVQGSSHGNNRGTGICYDFQNTGTCRFGTRCKFVHNGSGSSQPSATPTKKLKRSNEDISHFIKHLSLLPRDKLGSELFSSISLWRRCWQEHSQLDVKSRGMLLEVLGKTPGSSSVDPPPIELYEKVAFKFLHEPRRTDDEHLTSVKTVCDSVSRLLQFEWDQPHDDVKDGLSNVIIAAEGMLKKQHKDHRLVASNLCTVLEDLDKPWRIKLRHTSNLQEGSSQQQANPVSFADWKTANVKWLCNSSYFAPSSCPQMKVGPMGVYDSPEDYLETMHRLWVAMTFFDGHGALAPHCRSRGQSGFGCGSPLWPIGKNSEQITSRLRCRSNGCENPVEFACRMKSHDVLCGSCASRSITQHMKGPGTTASTHIYDCKVSNTNSDGVMYLVEFKCRNPPPSAVHWRTTKRLSPPNLVGIVRLRSKGASLSDYDQIKWGEIVFHGNSRDEDKFRQNGKVAINMSTIVDFEPELFEEGSFVAVIDCMTFVPEWIPVLKALESQKKIRIPFENGQPLNLCKDKPSKFVSIVEGSSVDEVFQQGRLALIEKLIDDSQLEPICEIRRDPALRDELAVKLEQLVTATTLDKKQLISFIDALRTPCHLVQGPPGTGKIALTY